MNIQIDNIVVNNRKRKLNKDKVRELAESMKLIGQLEPITITSQNGKYILLAGWHRLEAAKLLSWDKIDAQLFEGNELECELAEIDENLMRNDLTVLEQGEHLARRQELIGFSRGDNRFTIDRGSTVLPLKTTAELAHDIGLSETSAQRRMQAARNIVPEVKDAIRDTEIANSTTQLLELARLSPEKQIEVAQSIMDGALNIREAKRELIRRNKLESPPLSNGKYQVIYADPPWSYNNSGFDQSAASQYPTMSLEEIKLLPVNSICQNDSVLFLWATSPLLPEALEVIKEWGFQYKASMIWVKNKAPTIGWWVNTKHELLLIASKDINHPIKKFDSVFYADVKQHSQKPEYVYEMIEEMYHGSKIELFARNKRQGWTLWGNEI